MRQRSRHGTGRRIPVLSAGVDDPGARSHLALWLIAAAALSCDLPPREVAGWTIPVPEGTPLIEYEPVGEEDRVGNRLELARDLVIGAGAVGDADVPFHFVDGWKNLEVDCVPDRARRRFG